MRLTVFLVLVMTIPMSASVWSQTMSVKLKKATLKELFTEIEKKSDYRFFYSDDEVDVNQRVSVNAVDQSIAEILEGALENLPYSFKETDNKLILIESKTGGSESATLNSQQQKSVSGKVTDASGASLPGVTVVVKGTTTGVITDEDGKYALSNIPDNATMQFSFVGMKTQEIIVGDKTIINVSLSEESIGIGEIVTIGYGTVKKRDLTGAVANVTSAGIKNQAVVKDPIQFLQGKIAGADVTRGNAPGSSSSIAIRGYNSLNANNAPLIVVDDAPFGGRIDEINPAEIEKIDVLKDASSTAIYGSRGANGVIIITTKRANKAGGISIDYDSYFGVSKSLKNFDMMDGETFANFRRAAYYGKTDAEIFDNIQLNAIQTGDYVDWQEEMFSDTGYKTDHNISINQSNGKSRNLIVLGYNKDQSIIDNMSYERFSARINGDMELSNNLTIGYSSLLAYTNRNNGDASVWQYGARLDPLTQVYDENGNMRFYNSGWYQSVVHSNPMFDTKKENVDDQTNRSRTLLNLFADWKIITGLKFRTSLTYDLTNIENGSYYGSTSQSRQKAAPAANYQKASEKQISFTNILNYNRISGKHSFDASLVHDMQSYKYDNVGLSGQAMPYYGSWYNVNEAPSIFSRFSSINEWQLLSFMGRINYSFNDRYLLTVTGRYDGSSRLADGYKWDFFPSAAFGWRISEESFMKSIDFLNNLKLRLSWGNTGNTAISSYATQGALGRYPYIFGTTETSAIGYVPTELTNSELGWERTEEYNIGLDFGFLNNRINGSVDLYRRDTHDVLMQRNLPITTGYSSTWQNIGKTRNSGVELAMNFVPVTKKDLKWTVDLTFGYNKNEIVELFNGKTDSPGNNWFIGKPFYIERLYKYSGVWQTNEASQASVYGRKPGQVKVEDVNTNSLYDQADLFIYNKIPKWTGGLSTSLFYKNFDFNLYLYTRQDYGSRLGVLTDQAGCVRYNSITVDFWTPENPTNDYPQPTPTATQDLLQNSDYSYRDLSFVRIQNINLGYTLQESVARKILSKKVRIYLALDNPYIWTKGDYVGLDPENCNATSDHRPLTTFLVGINAKF